MMKRNLLYTVVGLVLTSTVACTNDIQVIGQMDEGPDRIYLAVGVDGAVPSRSPFYPTDGNGTVLTSPSMEHPLDVSVWASTTPGEYPNSGLNGKSGSVAIHTQAHFISGDPQLLGEAIYPKQPSGSETPIPVNFIGLHPKSVAGGNVWTVSPDNRNASYVFTGKDDVMFAPQISGTYGTAYNSSPTFHFYHLLTWLRIEMVADGATTQEREAVIEAWGNIQSMTITGKNQVTVSDLSNVTKDNLKGKVSFSGDAAMPLYYANTDNVFPGAGGYPIPKDLTDVAYVMCAPVDCAYKHVVDEKDVLKPEYILHLKTVNRELDIPIDLKKADGEDVSSFFTETDNIMGRQFTIRLNFKMGNVIGVSAAISLDANTDWFTHGTGTGDLKEGDFTEN